MVQAAEKLMHVLAQEASVYEDILAISKKKRDIIVAGKVSELESITKVEQSMVLGMHRLEEMREKALEEISAELGMKPDDARVSTLVERLAESAALKLKEWQGKMEGILDELRETNKLNSRLIRNSLEYMDFSINLMAAAGGDNNYGQSGRMNVGKNRNLVDVKL